MKIAEREKMLREEGREEGSEQEKLIESSHPGFLNTMYEKYHL